MSKTSRIKTVLICVLGFASVSTLDAQRTALHLVVESQFTFRGSKQVTTIEYWIADDRTHERQGRRAVIDRKDLGVRWVIDTEKGTYSETPGTTPAKSLKGGEEDIRTAGFGYEPEFAWKVIDDRKVSNILGRTCRLTTATGTDDFADVTLKLWFCSANWPAVERKATSSVIRSAQFRYDNLINFLTELAAGHPKALLMALEAYIEPPISSARHHRVEVLTIENAEAPKGIFDLPPGIHKSP